MKKIFLLLVILFLWCEINFAQLASAKWISVKETSDETIFIDSSNINLTEDQLSIVSLVVYKEPKLVVTINKKVKNEKSQILFNLTTRKYTVLGTLYYDSTLKIIGETSLPGLSIGKESFATSVDSNKTMLSLYNKGMSILNISPMEFKRSDSKSAGTLPQISILNNSPVQKNETNKLEERANKKNIDEINKFIDKSNLVEDKTQAEPLTSPAKKETRKLEAQGDDYKNSSERNLKGTIYTDGSKYCFQISSWRNKSKAEREVSNLKSKGHNAFIAEAYLPGKGGIWYRVRIGYFNSAEETENYLSRMR